MKNSNDLQNEKNLDKEKLELDNIEEIYNYFDKIGCLSFSTINEDGEPVSRIAHLRGFDEDGIYFMTMYTKSFYKQLKLNKKVSICGLCASTTVEHDDDGMPIFENGYSARMTGEVEEISITEIKNKNNPIFELCIKDQEKYNAMVVFCIKSARGDIFDYDFELINRENKLNRIYFSYNGKSLEYSGLKIDGEKCVSCGICYEKCSFKAIIKPNENNKSYSIDKYRCDECGDCYINCPTNAIFTR